MVRTYVGSRPVGCGLPRVVLHRTHVGGVQIRTSHLPSYVASELLHTDSLRYSAVGLRLPVCRGRHVSPWQGSSLVRHVVLYVLRGAARLSHGLQATVRLWLVGNRLAACHGHSGRRLLDGRCGWLGLFLLWFSGFSSGVREHYHAISDFLVLGLLFSGACRLSQPKAVERAGAGDVGVALAHKDGCPLVGPFGLLRTVCLSAVEGPMKGIRESLFFVNISDPKNRLGFFAFCVDDCLCRGKKYEQNDGKNLADF